MPEVRSHPSTAARWSVRCWWAALCAAVLEAVVHVVGGDHDVTLLSRAAVYAVVGMVMWQWSCGRRWAGWLLLTVLGTVGLTSLLAQPWAWWRAGNSLATYLALAGWSDWSIVLLRAVHVLAVLAGAALTVVALISGRGSHGDRPRTPVDGERYAAEPWATRREPVRREDPRSRPGPRQGLLP